MKRLSLMVCLALAAGCSGRGLQSTGPADLGSSGHHDLASGDAAGCPSDLYDAVGTSCPVEGQSCGGPCTDPCQFCNILQCEGGKWTQLEAAPDPNCGADMATNACTLTGGYCDPGDFVKPTCKSGYHEDDNITQSNPGVCGLGICCVPDDCRQSGCQPGSYCSGCLTATGVEYVCLGDGSAC